MRLRDYARYNVQRAKRGRSPIAKSTFAELKNIGIYTRDLEGWIEGSEALYAAKLAKAAEIKDYWVSIAPVWGDHDPKGAKPPTARDTNNPEDYKNSIQVIRRHGTVAVGTAHFPLAMWLEYGTHKMEAAACGAKTYAKFGGGEVTEKVTDKLFVG